METASAGHGRERGSSGYATQVFREAHLDAHSSSEDDDLALARAL